MAKTEMIGWNAFMKGEIPEKKKTMTQQVVKTAAMTSVAICITHAIPVALPFLAKSLMAAPVVHHVSSTVPVIADPSFQAQLSAATKPIKDILYGFAHEIYFIFMSWGAIEALVGKPQQGFQRMKIATLAYILLFWVPWIVDQVNHVKPSVGW